MVSGWDNSVLSALLLLVPIYIRPPNSVAVDCTQSATFIVDYMVQIIGKTELLLPLFGVKLKNCFLLWHWMSSLSALKAGKNFLCEFCDSACITPVFC